MEYNQALFEQQINNGLLFIDLHMSSYVDCGELECHLCSLHNSKSKTCFLDSNDLSRWKEFLSQRYPEEFV